MAPAEERAELLDRMRRTTPGLSAAVRRTAPVVILEQLARA
jgi:hypothetical protein